MVEHILCMDEALGLIPSTARKRKKEVFHLNVMENAYTDLILVISVFQLPL